MTDTPTQAVCVHDWSEVGWEGKFAGIRQMHMVPGNSKGMALHYCEKCFRCGAFRCENPSNPTPESTTPRGPSPLERAAVVFIAAYNHWSADDPVDGIWDEATAQAFGNLEAATYAFVKRHPNV